jgi:predicted nucleic acid-binding protein
MSLLADTSFVLALFDRSARGHAEAQAFYLAAEETILLPAITLPELAFYFNRLGGSKGVANALRATRSSRVELIDLVEEDYDRAADILTKYHDSRIDFVDACIMALAERLKITRILTFDRRDFGLYRPAHCDFFELLP